MSEKKLHRWYKEVLSGYNSPKKKEEFHRYDVPVGSRLRSGQQGKDHSEPRIKLPILKEENMGRLVCIDEKNIGDECFTIISNPETCKIILMANTLRTKDLVDLLVTHISREKRFNIRCVARDLASN